MRLTLDHVIPLKQHGPHDIENIVPACRSCNSRKGAKTPDQANMPLLRAPLKRDTLPGMSTNTPPQ